MEIVTFFTRPEKLNFLGIYFEWDYNIRPILKGYVSDSKKEIWAVWDEIDIADLKKYFSEVVSCSMFIYVYHDDPREIFRQQLNKYLLESTESLGHLFSHHIPNAGFIYEKLENIFPNSITNEKFNEIKFELLKTCKFETRNLRDDVKMLLNECHDMSAVLGGRLKINKYLPPIPETFTRVTIGVNENNFYKTMIDLRDELNLLLRKNNFL